MAYFIFQTDIGWTGVTNTPAGLSRLILPRKTPEEVGLLLGVPYTRESPAPPELNDVISRLKSYFRGDPVSFPDKLNLTGATAFQRAVWEATRLIPFGETRSYGWIAEKIGDARWARAAGNALGLNRLPVIVPCHRVLRKDGSLGGFSGGLEIKKFLLALEGGCRTEY